MPEEMVSQDSQPKKRILVADDDPTLRLVVKSVVEKAGYQAVVVNDGREAFQVLKSDANFVAAIFDVQMPHIEGPDLVRHMRTEKRLMKIPVMIMTASDSMKISIDSFAAGAVVFLPKPFTPEQMTSLLNMMIKKGAA